MAQDYGLLSNLVSTATTIVAAGAAVTLTWKGRARWEPSETDVPKGAAKVGGLVASICIVLLRATSFDHAHQPFLVDVALRGAALCVLALLAYGYVISALTFDHQHAGAKTTKTIGGFRLMPYVKAAMAVADGPRTEQEAFKSAAFDPDLVWTRGSRALAKQVFVVCYLLLVAAGTVALAASAMLLDLVRQG